MYAVIKTGGKQYKISEGDSISIEKFKTQVGKFITFKEVMIMIKNNNTILGKPYIKNVSVLAEVINITKGPKVIIFKHKRRKGFRKKTGHRQLIMNVKIKKISNSLEEVNNINGS